MTYRTKFIDPDYRRDPKTNHFCARCQKDLKADQPFRVIHQVDGGPFALHVNDEALYTDDGGNLGCSPVGMDCARKIGLHEFTSPAAGYPVDA